MAVVFRYTLSVTESCVCTSDCIVICVESALSHFHVGWLHNGQLGHHTGSKIMVEPILGHCACWDVIGMSRFRHTACIKN